ncbi:type I iterative polyketide synthase [Penicillium canescens]|nr:type I iterative polyketide synthase [Penicillium canescens]
MLQGLHTASAENIITSKSIVIEFGPHPVVLGMVKSCLGNEITCLSTLRRNKDPWKILANSSAVLYSAGADIDWSKYHRDFSAAQCVLPLPSYSWYLKSYWIPYKNDWTLYKGDHVCDGDAAPEKISKLLPLLRQRQPRYIGWVYTLGNYFLDRFSQQLKGKDGEKYVDIINMVIEKALIAENAGPQFLRVAAELDWSSKEAAVRYYSVDSNHVESIQHALCRIRFSDKSTFDTLAKDMPTIQTHIKTMREKSCKGAIFRFNGPMAYNMVQALAEFHPDYRCIDETILDNETLEAAFTSGGFVMNANTKTNHGWDSFQLYERVTDDIPYQTYVQMIPSEAKQWKGNVVILSGDRLVGSVGGLTLQGVPRRILRYILKGSAKPSKASRTDAVPPKAPPQTMDKESSERKNMPPNLQRVSPVASVVRPVPPVTPQVHDSTTESRSDRLAQALRIISDQSNVPIAELMDDAVFADIGIDSLLALTITSAFSEELDLDLDSSFFIDHPTVADLKKSFGSSISSPPGTQVIAPAETRPIFIPQVQSSSRGQQPVALPPTGDSVVADMVRQQLQANTSTADNGIFQSALCIIADESGVSPADLTGETAFADIGIDSLLALVISSRLSEELALDIDAESFFQNCVTVLDLQNFLQGKCSESPSLLVRAQAQPSATQTTLVSVSSKQTVFAPVTETLPEPRPLQTLAHSQPSPLVVAQTQKLAPPNEPDPSFLEVLQVIREESGVEVSDLSDETVFADIGVDSLLALVIGSRIREELLWDLDVESILISHPTVKDLKVHMRGRGSVFQPDQNLSSSSISSFSSAFASSDSVSSAAETPGSESSAYELGSSIPNASSAVLQGSPRNAEKILFLFPYGPGSATSYTSLPRIAANVAVISLNSPFLKNGAEMRCTIDELVGSYLEEICACQATGPYHLAGWSASSILAYRAAQMLVARGEQVPCLALLDAPPPMGLGKHPQHFFDNCDAMGIFGQGGNAPEWLIPHFKGTNAVLNGYYATPFATGQAPSRTGIIWASQSVFDTKGCARPALHPNDTEDMKFLTETRTDFSAGI